MHGKEGRQEGRRIGGGYRSRSLLLFLSSLSGRFLFACLGGQRCDEGCVHPQPSYVCMDSPSEDKGRSINIRPPTVVFLVANRPSIDPLPRYPLSGKLPTAQKNRTTRKPVEPEPKRNKAKLKSKAGVGLQRSGSCRRAASPLSTVLLHHLYLTRPSPPNLNGTERNGTERSEAK